MNTTPVIGLNAVTRRFDAVTAVDRVSIDLKEGEFFALLGPSGCGKTTLLRMIAGFEEPDEGAVLLDGIDITRMRPNRRPINLMFQSYALFPHMSVYNNIAYGLEMENTSKSEIGRRVAEMLAMTQLDALASRKPDQLSGGQRQRVALARALVKRPRVLLLDEPLGALDRKLRGQMQLELKRLQHDLGITFVVVTHDQEEALVMADRIALMKDGRIEQLGGPEELYERPESRFVADFIGVSNFFDGTTSGTGLEIAGGEILRGECSARPGAGGTLAVRPERILLSAPDRLEGWNSVKGQISDIAYHGQDINVHVSVAGSESPVLARLSAAGDDSRKFSIGQSVWCNWRPEHGRILTN